MYRGSTTYLPMPTWYQALFALLVIKGLGIKYHAQCPIPHSPFPIPHSPQWHVSPH
jgi:hypothetical protein